MFGVIIFCILCYLLYRYDLKHADYRVLKVEYTNGILKYFEQRKILNYFWIHIYKSNYKYQIVDMIKYHREKLEYRRKKRIKKEIVDEFNIPSSNGRSSNTNGFVGSSGSSGTSGTSGSSGTSGNSGSSGSSGTSGTALNPNI